MKITTSTGLIASPVNKLIKRNKPASVQLGVVATSAPYVLKPYAGLYNPYPYRCSLLCNHPADLEARELVKKAKDSWTHEGRNLLLTEEMEAIRSSLNQLHVRITDYDELTVSNNNDMLPIECVPEELFRRYTETDSRPLTPTQTLTSAHTRASGSRRCVTPDPTNMEQVREKTTLVLDLRRSHSQETISWHSSNLFHREEIPSITILKVNSDRRSKSATSFNETSEIFKKKKERANTSSVMKAVKTIQEPIKTTQHLTVNANQDSDNESEIVEDDEESFKRRGRKRRKRLRDGSRDLSAVHSSIDPETQIATIGPESHNPSARPSLVPTETIVVDLTNGSKSLPKNPVTSRQPSFTCDSYLNLEMIKLLRRELNEEVIDSEFNMKRRLALEEAFKTVNPDEPVCEELLELKKEIVSEPVSEEMWLNVPRKFSRSSVRFELPMDSRRFKTLTPLQYLSEHTWISSCTKKLYNFIFNRNKIESEMEHEVQRRLLGRNLATALNEMMGQDMTEEQAKKIRYLVGWEDKDKIDFKTFCGICALCERILGPEYCPKLLDKKLNPCEPIETIDFQSLSRRLSGQNPDQRLLQILNELFRQLFGSIQLRELLQCKMWIHEYLKDLKPVE